MVAIRWLYKGGTYKPYGADKLAVRWGEKRGVQRMLDGRTTGHTLVLMEDINYV